MNQNKHSLGFIAVKIHHDHGNSIKKNIHLEWLTSESQSIIIMVEEWQHADRCAGTDSPYILSRRHRKLTESHNEGSLSKQNVETYPHSDTLPPTRLPLLIVLVHLGAIFFSNTTQALPFFSSTCLLGLFCPIVGSSGSPEQVKF